MDGQVTRRESRIPKLPPAATGRPLAEKSNVMERKRRGAPLDGIPEAKRAVRGVSASSAAAAAPTAADAAAKPEESWEDIAERTGMSVEDLLTKKLTFKKGTLPAKKLEEMGPMIKELKALGWHVLQGKGKADMDAKQWEQDAAEKQQRIAELEAELSKLQQELQQQINSHEAAMKQAEARAVQLQQQLAEAESRVAAGGEEVAGLQKQLEGVQAELEKTAASLAEKEAKVKEMEDVVRQSQAYASTLQAYNTSLQGDVQMEKGRRDELAREKDALQGQVAELGGMVKSQERLLELEKEQCKKLREEREGALRDLAVLRCDVEAGRSERERLAAELKEAREELDKYKDAGGKSEETLEAVKHSKATLEAQLTSQRSLINAMRQELGSAKEQHALAESLANSRESQVKELQAQLQGLQASLADAERRVYESELIRRKLHNTIQELKGNIRVFARVRPPSSSEMSADGGSGALATEFPNSGELLGRGLDITVPGSLTGQAPQRHSFAFDKVFGPAAGQGAVFEEISELIQSALDGHKVCIFAYGQTGSGKTYTMFGNDDNRGIIPRAMAQVFESSRSLGKQGWRFAMQASMLEIYNEDYKDLLARKKLPDGRSHKVVHDTNGGTSVSDLTLIDVNTPQDVEELLSRAMEKRSVGCTQLNEQSSRSHAVFTLRIEGTNDSSKLKVSGVLNLIDLAGSERVKESGATGQRLKEAQAINKSLSALGDVIVSLANKESHIPYRNSKLTWLLQPCLGGDAKTLMFVNISPTSDFAPESLCSLRFAAKVNACEIGVARRNVRTT
uniref:Kinesin-like protein n=1 Tax=Tetradesmus obliquus TaxID=3088 RepID=A0A383VYM2_TETOB|eukprot:jgi/Sobl393_1/4739/SZX70311.1